MENTNPEVQKNVIPQWGYLAVIGLLLATSIYLFYKNNKLENKSDLLSDQVETIATDKMAIETDYNAALVRLDEMKNTSVQMDSLLQTKNTEIDDLKNKINAIVKNKNATEAELKEAAGMIKELNSKLNNYQQQIIALKNENIQLTEDKKQLIEDKNEITQQKENLQTEKTTLEKTVELGSVLHASNIRLEAINIKKNLLGEQKEKETARARKVDLMRISFDLDDNRISESGEKMVYICILKPNGTIANNGNKFNLVGGNSMYYSTSKTVPYRKGEKSQGISTDWKPNEEFETGNYRVEIYHEGYKIGSQLATLK